MLTVKEVFDKIYQAAVKKDIEELNTVLSDGYSIELTMPYLDPITKKRFVGSAAYRLAYENNHSAVKFLLKHGANKRMATAGYAAAGNVEYVNKYLLTKGAKKEIAAEIDETAHSYAWAGKFEQVDELLKQGADISKVAHGYAWGGFDDQADELIKQGADKNLVAHGYAHASNYEKVKLLIKKGAKPEMVAQVYAQFNDEAHLAPILNNKMAKTLAACGFALVGNTDRVNQLLAQGADRPAVVSAYAYAGNVVEVKNIIQDLHIEYAVIGFARGRHVKQVNALVADGASIVHAAEAYAEEGYHSELKGLKAPYSPLELEFNGEISRLRMHGESLRNEGFTNKGNKVIQIAGELFDVVTQYKKKEIDATTAKASIAKITQDNMHEMGKYRNAKDITGHVFLGLTGVGLGLMLYRKYQTESKSMFFNATNRQRFLGYVNHYAEQLDKEDTAQSLPSAHK